MILKKKNIKNIDSESDKLKRWFEEELKRKDEVIERLREENKILLKTALKQSKNLCDVQDTMMIKGDRHKDNKQITIDKEDKK